MGVCIGATNSKLTENVLPPTAHRAICKNCTSVGSTCSYLCDCATHIHLHRIRLVCATHAHLSLSIASPAPHAARTSENTRMLSASHHLHWRRNSAITKHTSTHRQQALHESRMIRTTQLPLIVTTPTPDCVVALDGTRKCSSSGNAPRVINA